MLAMSPLGVLLGVQGGRNMVARARDVTDVPLTDWWTTTVQAPHRPPLRQRWWGREHRNQVVSMTLLVLAILFLVALAGISIAAIVSSPNMVSLRFCDYSHGCSPIVSFVWIAGYSSFFAVFPLTLVAQPRWLQHVEATSGVWFRYPDVVQAPPTLKRKTLCYLRQPGVTPEAAGAALTRLSTRRDLPYARQVAIHILFFVGFMLPICATYILSTWLRYQWLPG
jgi:uncharacterized Tic20 family protein